MIDEYEEAKLFNLKNHNSVFRNSVRETKSTEEDDYKTFQAYRCFQILNGVFNRNFSPVILPTWQYLQTAALVFSNFNIIQFHSQLAWSILILMNLYSVTLIIGRSAIYFPNAARVFTHSTKLISSRRFSGTSNPDDPLQKKAWRSCSPLKIEIRRISFLKRDSSVLAFGVIIYCTMRMIIAFE